MTTKNTKGVQRWKREAARERPVEAEVFETNQDTEEQKLARKVELEAIKAEGTKNHNYKTGEYPEHLELTDEQRLEFKKLNQVEKRAWLAKRKQLLAEYGL